MKEISAQQTKDILTHEAEIAFLDVREHGQYGEGHPFFSVNMPYSQIEMLAPRLVPSLGVKCVLLDDGDGVSERAAAALEGLGYRDVVVLTGGAPAWQAAGYTLFKGVNLPSKTFGELVEHKFDTKSISAEELDAYIKNDYDYILLDGRSMPEFHKMTLPTSQSCPNAELGYRLPMLCKDPTTPIIINCAGRTRSIIGAQGLVLLDIPNPIYALRNGTQGWRLAGFDLVHGASPLPLPELDAETLEAGRALAADLRKKYGLQTITGEETKAWLADPERSTFLFDVRTEEEFTKGHVTGAQSAPGGQLVQATDEKLAVRNARIILSCDNGLRSASTAIWLVGMGHQVYLLDTNTPMDAVTTGAAKKNISTIDAEDLKKRIDAGAKVLDASKGLDYRAGHIDGAQWVTRARLDAGTMGDLGDLVIVGQSSALVKGIIAEFKADTGQVPQDIFIGTTEQWRDAGLSVVETPESPSEMECIDHLFFVHDRHDGNLDAARRYLEWETGLLDQLDDQERSIIEPLVASQG